MPVVIRMKQMGRKHRQFFRICAANSRSPRDGRVIEELGTYDPEIPEVDARVNWNAERVAYWLSVGAQPSVNIKTFIKKYGQQGTHLKEQEAARQKLSLPKVVGPAPAPVFVPSKKSEAAPAAEAAPEAPAQEAEASAENA
ncbi:MAG: 30S ribosomal protein S16 [Planctomycetes bacterium]|nr:30S ribosomal protein S16 [Planctomycetota bacterium]